MRSAKYVGLFVACGFILSFVSGLFSHSSILSILLKALIFALVFGVLGFGISFIYSKFLSDGSNGDFQGEYTADSSSGISQQSALGQNVDITIQDEELKPSESENHFVVGENHQMLNESDVRNSEKAAATEQESPKGFVPLRNFETVNNFSGKEAVVPFEAAAANQNSENSAGPSENIGAGGLDTLPDMENFVFSESGSSNSEDDDALASGTGSEFVTSSGSHKKNDAPAEIQDAALMAKAISSVLSDENYI